MSDCCTMILFIGQCLIYSFSWFATLTSSCLFLLNKSPWAIHGDDPSDGNNALTTFYETSWLVVFGCSVVPIIIGGICSHRLSSTCKVLIILPFALSLAVQQCVCVIVFTLLPWPFLLIPTLTITYTILFIVYVYTCKVDLQSVCNDTPMQ